MLEQMDRRGVDRAVVHPIDIADPELGESSTEWVLTQTQRYPDRFIPFANLNPTEPGSPKRLIHYVRDYGCRGLKLHPPLHDFSLEDPAVAVILHTAGELQVPVLIHTGPIFVRSARLRYGDAAAVDDLARTCPDTTIVLAHGDPFGDSAVLAGKHPNVYIDISIILPRLAEVIPGLLKNTLEWISEGTQEGADKVLFGSDANPLRPDRLEKTLHLVETAGLDLVTRDKILGGNAARLLALDPKD
jgi:predicted TIM-barrel fold metal-dependent hydrolase